LVRLKQIYRILSSDGKQYDMLRLTAAAILFLFQPSLRMIRLNAR